MNLFGISLDGFKLPDLTHLHISFSLSGDLHTYQPLAVHLAVLALALLVLCFAQRDTASEIMRIVRFRIFWYPLIGPGTALHETSHAIMMILTGAGIRKFVPFHPQADPDDPASGAIVFGYCQARWEVSSVRKALYYVAPLYIVPPVLFALSVLLIGQTDAGHLIGALTAAGPARAALWAAVIVLGGRSAGPSIGDHYSHFALGLIIAILLVILVVAVGFLGVAYMAALLTAIGAVYGLIAIIETGLLVLTRVL